MEKIRIAELLSGRRMGERVAVTGWTRTIRDSKTNAFIALNDGSCLKNLQIFIDKADSQLADALKAVSTGASVEATGTLVESPAQGQTVELRAESLRVVGTCPEDYPLQKKRHGMEFLREIAHLRARTNTFGAVFRVRHAVSFAIHQFFDDRGFYYVNTPIITGSDAEGAGEMFQVTTLDIESIKGEPDYSRDFFEKRTSLTVSGQLNGEAFATALGKIYTFGPTFRAENSNTVRHMAEFWMIEPEMAFCNLDDDAAVAEEFLKYLISYVINRCAEDLAFFNERVEPGLLDKLNAVLASPFRRMTYTEAVDILTKSGKKFEYPVAWGLDLKSEHERYITEEVVKGPVVVTNYPKEIKSFYMKLNADGKTVRGMDILVPGIGEIIGGSEREENYDVLLARMKESGLKEEDYRWYLDLRKFGSVPHAGFGLGLERFIMYVTGMANIRDVIPFPRAAGLCDF